jgi:hypothetical protein
VKTTQLVAWLMCLILAFVAMLASVRNWVQIAVLQRDCATANTAMVEQTAVLRDIRSLLQQMVPAEGDQPTVAPAEPDANR